jgi:putative inorganic carbon (hco3(-)) transporter
VQGSIALLLVFGVLVSGSLACLALLVPVIAALGFMLRPDWRLPLPVVALGGLLVIGGLGAFLLYGPIANDLTAKGVVAGISRHDFLITGSRIVADFAPLGSGLGTFKDIYRWYEDPAIVGTIFVNHAHNDLLELLIETGLVGLVALGLFLAWFVPAGVRVWSVRTAGPIAQAASVVIGVELLHSLVDYPLRTAAMSAMMALCCVLLVRPADPVEASGRSRRGRATESKHELIEI